MRRICGGKVYVVPPLCPALTGLSAARTAGGASSADRPLSAWRKYGRMWRDKVYLPKFRFIYKTLWKRRIFKVYRLSNIPALCIFSCFCPYEPKQEKLRINIPIAPFVLRNVIPAIYQRSIFKTSGLLNCSAPLFYPKINIPVYML